MRIRIHACDVRCLGRACFSLMELLQRQLHTVDINVVWFGDEEPLVDDSKIDLNIDEIRSIDFMHLAHMSPRRENAERMLTESGITFSSVRGGVWLDHRDEMVRCVRVLFQIHLDEHFYFDQVSTVDAWSLGTVVLCEDVNDMANYDLQKGTHLIAGKLAGFPQLAKQVIAERQNRIAAIKAAQELLREKYIVDTLHSKVEEIIEGVM